ncbi:AraC family transcriptional regulator [Alloprevotella sp. OH1205_COT-284]|uniref:helix-turn-helix domain-containing protein n=1 Tax=Alloprevotella sp. OH1205_COT-284 TaxID=2491043 RepID=UPI000F5E0E18|nr:helix-turn-helix domain-containing protein [Alloprevotella sp. OH1205_COT-284]RRD80190.1 AraC family transcriptional regulator [Alloprevotella sp. OH1205_COT-284]
MNKNKEYIHVALHDVLPYANTLSLGEDDLLIVDDVRRIDFENRALQTGFFTIGYCTRGEARFKLNGRQMCLYPGCLFVSLGQQVIEDGHYSDDFQVVAVLQSHQFVQEILMSMLNLWPYLLYLLENPVITLQDEEQRWIWRDYLLLLQRLKNKTHTFRREAILSILQAFYLDICHFLEQRCSQRSTSNSRTYDVFYRFMQLLAQNYKREREVAWYAAQLQLTPKYLSEVVKNVSGRTVSQWVSTVVVMEIKSMLRNTNLSVKEISIKMNFPNQSFMGKYFKNITQRSPLEYRKEK